MFLGYAFILKQPTKKKKQEEHLQTYSWLCRHIRWIVPPVSTRAIMSRTSSMFLSS